MNTSILKRVLQVANHETLRFVLDLWLMSLEAPPHWPPYLKDVVKWERDLISDLILLGGIPRQDDLFDDLDPEVADLATILYGTPSNKFLHSEQLKSIIKDPVLTAVALLMIEAQPKKNNTARAKDFLLGYWNNVKTK